ALHSHPVSTPTPASAHTHHETSHPALVHTHPANSYPASVHTHHETSYPALVHTNPANSYPATSNPVTSPHVNSHHLISHPANSPSLSHPSNSPPSNSHPAHSHLTTSSPANSHHANSNPTNSHPAHPTSSSLVPIPAISIDLPIIPYSQSAANSHHMLTRSKTKAPHSLPSALLTHTSHVSSAASAVPDLDLHEPPSHREASHSPKWLVVMQEEYSSLLT
ncbi:hypothetical protein U1Q18_043753, partial [Sarracenia purpurea var. burkii]